MSCQSDNEPQLSILWRMGLLFLGAVPVLLYSLIKLHAAAYQANQILPEGLPKKDLIESWGIWLGILASLAFFIPQDFSKRNPNPLFWPMVVAIILGPCLLLVLIGVIFPNEYHVQRNDALLYVGWGVLSIIFGAPCNIYFDVEPLKRVKRATGIFLVGLLVSLVFVLPGLWLGRNMIWAKGMAVRQHEKELMLQEIRASIMEACQQGEEMDALIDKIEAQTFPFPAEGQEVPAGSLASALPALIYCSSCGKEHRQKLYDDTTQRELEEEALPEEKRAGDSISKDVSSPLTEDASAKNSLSCSYRDFLIQERPEPDKKESAPGVLKNKTRLVAASEIKTIARIKVVKEENIGYYSNGGGYAYETTVEVEIIFLPTQQIVAKKLFDGSPSFYGGKGLSLDGFGDAEVKAYEWLGTLFAQPPLKTKRGSF